VGGREERDVFKRADSSAHVSGGDDGGTDDRIGRRSSTYPETASSIVLTCCKTADSRCSERVEVNAALARVFDPPSK
jgi:hypothetical protein